MDVSSRTTDGLPNECPVCGKQVWVVPSAPAGDATCPHCGSTIWFQDPAGPVPDVLRVLESRGAIVETDDEGQVRSIRLVGSVYTDWVVDELFRLKGVDVIDITETCITPAGAARMRRAMPETAIVSRRDEPESNGR